MPQRKPEVTRRTAAGSASRTASRREASAANGAPKTTGTSACCDFCSARSACASSSNKASVSATSAAGSKVE